MAGDIKALLFDVFGTVVDWRSSLIANFTRWAGSAASTATGPPWSTPGAAPTCHPWTRCGVIPSAAS